MTWMQRLRESRFWPMLWKEFIQMRRDRLTLVMVTVVPAVQLLLFGYAIQTDVRHQPMVVLDESRTVESRALTAAIANTGTFDYAGEVHSRREIQLAIRTGQARAALVIPPDYERLIKRGETARAQMIVYAADPSSSQAAMSGAQLAAASRAQAIIAERGRIKLPLEMTVRPWYNPAGRSAVFIVPGIVGVLLTVTMTIITSGAIVRARERGTLEQLIVTPIGKTSLMLGKLVPFVLVGYLQMTVVLVLAWAIFDVPLVGSIPLLYALASTFIAASLGVGLLVSTIARNQAQAMQMSFFFMLPNILLSGYMFPREAMPDVARWVGLVLPLTYFLKVLRGILLKGSGLAELWREVSALAIMATVLVSVSVRRFHKTIE
ncbi:MAG: ABC transporter permease [Gemmatimonadetes bacterium]|nr:ABC transporter permease [Gemmatimonadota bacterium]